MSEVALKLGCAVQEASVADEIRSSAELCRAALATDPLASVGQLSLAPQSPQACFDLVLGIPYDARCMEVVRRLKRDAAERGHSAPFAVERFLALQTYLVALPLLQQMPVPDSIKRQFCITCRDIASTPQQPDQRLALESHEFPELAQIATLRRFHAGQCSFDVIRRMPFAWLLKAHPFDLSGFIGTLCFGMRGVGPMVEPHINWWRANQMLLTKREHERSIWRIAQFVEERPEIKGLVSSSWLYGVETGDQSPHLAWLREFYAAENARIIDAGPVVDARKGASLSATSCGGSNTSAASFAHARQSCCGLVRTCWPGRAATPNLPTEPAERAASPAPKPIAGAPARPPARRWQSGRWTLIDGRRLLFYRPRRLYRAES